MTIKLWNMKFDRAHYNTDHLNATEKTHSLMKNRLVGAIHGRNAHIEHLKTKTTHKERQHRGIWFQEARFSPKTSLIFSLPHHQDKLPIYILAQPTQFLTFSPQESFCPASSFSLAFSSLFSYISLSFLHQAHIPMNQSFPPLPSLSFYMS